MKRITKLLAVFLVFTTVFMSSTMTAQAKSVISKDTLKYIEQYDDVTRRFSLSKSGAVAAELTLEMDNSCRTFSTGKSGLKVSLYNEDTGACCCSYKFRIRKGYSDWDFFFWCDKILPAGDYYMTFEALTRDSVNCKYKLSYYNSFADSFKIPKTINVKTNHTKGVAISSVSPSGALHGADFKISNPKLAEIYFDAENAVYIYGKKAGKCVLTAKLENGKKYNYNVVIKNPAPELNYTDVSLYYGESENLKVLFTKKKATWKTSNKKVAVVNKNGKVTAKGKGKCVIAAKCGKKTYKAKVTVTNKEPDFIALVRDYNTRNNYFTVEIKNLDSKSLTIVSKNAKCLEKDYKVYDRKLYLPKNKNVTIKGHKSKVLRFYVKGDVTWYDHESFWLLFNFKFNGKTYQAKSWYQDSSYKIGKKWYDTYWDNIELYDMRGYE